MNVSTNECRTGAAVLMLTMAAAAAAGDEAKTPMDLQKTVAAEVATSGKDASATKTLLSIINRSSGKDAQDWQTYLLDDAAASVSAASIVGIDASVLTIAESTRDIGMLIKAKDSNGKGVGFSVTPARVSNPFPRVDFADYANSPLRWQPVVNLTISFAQGTTSTDGRDYARRGVALSTGGTFHKEDDPIYQRASAFTCADEAIGEAYRKLAPPKLDGPLIPDPSAGQPQSVKVPEVQKALKTCLDKLTAQNDQRWFRPVWSLTLATGDGKLDKAGEKATKLGNSLAVAARYGAPIMAKTQVRKTDLPDGAGKDDKQFDWGWAVAASLRLTRGDPVLSTLGSGAVERRSGSLLALRASAGTDSLRFLLEGSRQSSQAKDTRDQTLKQAVGVDFRMTKGAWLNFRYGKRNSLGSSGDEAASLLTLTISSGVLDWVKL
jgi:hypothetical protein